MVGESAGGESRAARSDVWVAGIVDRIKGSLASYQDATLR